MRVNSDTWYGMLTREQKKKGGKKNAACSWGFNNRSFAGLVSAFKAGDDSTKAYIIYRLVDANFHYEAGFLLDNDPAGALKAFRMEV